jgi:RNA polymerase sigma factor (sigma-70 family)
MHTDQSAAILTQPMGSQPTRSRPTLRRARLVDPPTDGDVLRLSRNRSATSLPAELDALLHASDATAQDEAWSMFADRYHRLILRTARDVAGDHDGAMDRYTHVLESLRKDDFHRLRAYAADSRGKFTTWLVVVTRRLCEDYRRSRYGRVRESRVGDERVIERQETRRRLTELVAAELDPELIADGSRDGADAGVRHRELTAGLARAVGGLDTRDQLLLKLRFEDELSAREIARVLGLPTSFHVYRRLNARLKELKDTLHSLGITDAAP